MEPEKVKLFQIDQEASIKEAMLQLTKNGIKILFAVDHQHLIGTLTDGDIRRGITSGVDLSTKIGEIVARRFIGLNAGDPALREKARALMQEHLIEYVPVIDSGRRLTDIISWRDYILPDEKPRLTDTPALPCTVVIMAGGKGVRLDPFTKILPKPLIPMGDKPIVELIMDRFYEQGFHQFTLLLNHKKEMVKLYFSESTLPYSIELVEEEAYGGTVGGLRLLRSRIKGTFILTNCDTLLEGDYREFLHWHTQNRNVLTIIGSHKEVAVPYGVLNMNNGKLIEMVEKPKFDLFVNTGTYVVEPEVLAAIDGSEAMDMDRLIATLQARGEKRIGVFPCWGGWFDIGQWEEYRKTLRKMGIES